MKKWLPWFFLFFGCFSQGLENTLSVWVTYQGAEEKLFRKIVKQFEKEYWQTEGKKIQVQVKLVPFSDLLTYLRMACLSGEAPDVARVDIFQMANLAYHKVLYPLDTLANFDVNPKEFLEAPFSTNVIRVGNTVHLYGLPEQVTCLALFWNQELFEKKGKALKAKGLSPKRAPRDWEEFIQYGQVLTEKGDSPLYGFAMVNSLWWTIPFFATFGSSVFEEKEGRLICLLGDLATSEAFQFKVDLYRRYGIEGGAWKPGALSPEVGFLNQRYAMIFGGPWMIKTFLRRGLNFRVSFIPRLPDKWAEKLGISPPPSGTVLGGNNLVVLKKAKNPGLAYRFIRYVTSFKVQREWCEKLQQIPVRRDVWELFLKQKKLSPFMEVFLRQVQYAVPPPPLPQYSYLESEIVNPEMELALRGIQTARKALCRARERIQKEILERLKP